MYFWSLYGYVWGCREGQFSRCTYPTVEVYILFLTSLWCVHVMNHFPLDCILSTCLRLGNYQRVILKAMGKEL